MLSGWNNMWKLWIKLLLSMTGNCTATYRTSIVIEQLEPNIVMTRSHNITLIHLFELYFSINIINQIGFLIKRSTQLGAIVEIVKRNVLCPSITYMPPLISIKRRLLAKATVVVPLGPRLGTSLDRRTETFIHSHMRRLFGRHLQQRTLWL